MTKKELKILIKECMAELMLEMKFEQIIESALVRSSKSSTSSLNENVAPQSRPRPQPKQQPQQPKINLKEKMKISDSEWNSIYASVDQNSPIMTESKTGQHNPEFVSEDVLEDTGLLRDYSKFL